MSSLYILAGLGFFIVMAIYWSAVFTVLYHLIRFGVSASPKKMAVIFLGGSLLLSLITTLLFTQINFSSISDSMNANVYSAFNLNVQNTLNYQPSQQQ